MKHTTAQRRLIQHIHAETSVTRTQLEHRVNNPALLNELLTNLYLNGHIEHDTKTNTYKLTDETTRQAEHTKQHVQRATRGITTCASCITEHCACQAKITCIGNGPHSLGCHGTHD